MLRKMTPGLSRVPTEFLLREIARRSRSALLAINWKTIDSPGDYESRVYAHGKRCEVLGLLCLADESINGGDVDTLEAPEDFPNPPDRYEAVLGGVDIQGFIGEG